MNPGSAIIRKLIAWATPATADEETLRRSRVLILILGGTLAVNILNLGLLLGLGWLGTLPDYRAFIPIDLVAFFLFLVCVFFLRRGRLSLASCLYLFGLQLISTWAFISTGASVSEALIYFVPAVAIAGLLLGPRGGLVFALTPVALFAGVLWARSHGWIRVSPLDLPAEDLPSLFNLLAITTLTLLLATWLEQTLRQARQRNRELAQAKTFNERIVQMLEEGILIEDAQGIITFANPRLEALLGYSPGGLIGKHWSAIVSARARPAVQDELAKRPQGISSRYETVLQASDGREVPVLIAAVPLFEDGRYSGVLSAMTDISARIQLEELQRQFIAVASHELRSPLQSIAGYLDLILSDEAMDAATQHQFLHIVRNEAERLINLADGLLDLRRLEAGQVELNLQPADVYTLVEEVIRQARPLAQRRSIDLVNEVAADLPAVVVDHQAFNRILTNLVTNAIKFTPQAGAVRVVAAVSGEALPSPPTSLSQSSERGGGGEDTASWLRVQVCDIGPGIPPEELDKVFDRFYRGSNSRNLLGAGLGLTIARELVEAQGGRIWAESVPGRGSIFSFTVPLAASPLLAPPGGGKGAGETRSENVSQAAIQEAM